jgi:hypothetical protein
MAKHTNDSFKMLLFMSHLSIMLERLDDLKGLNVYERKIKMRADALLKELESYDKALNEAAKKRKDSEAVMQANLQYANARDSLSAWCDVWEQFISLSEANQEAMDEDLRKVFSKYQITVLYESNQNT